MQNSLENNTVGKGGIFEGVKAYHWILVLIASCGWLFDCMDQRIFALARQPALREVLLVRVEGEADAEGNAAWQKAADVLEEQKFENLVKTWVGWATGTMMIGWATGGIIFGIMSDRWGRVKTMVVTLIVYSGFTGLSGLSRTQFDFLAYRFLVGLGVGGMFGAATTLVAESVPGRFRALALGSLQALSASGNIIGSLVSIQIQPGSQDFLWGMSGWRIIFFVGILPALLVVPVVLVLREPERWKETRRKALSGEAGSRKMGSLSDLLGHPIWRRNLLVGVGLGLAGMAGLWGIGFFSPELVDAALKGQTQEVIDRVRGFGTALQDVGSFFGMFCFTLVATFVGRKPAFLGAFILCLVTTIFVFNSLSEPWHAYWMLPLMGFAQLSVFGGYSIYFPELFPTRLRGTGVGFCYNTVRYLAAGFPPMLMFLNSQLTAMEVKEPFRMAATILSFIFVLGIVALIWAPETKDQPLPEE